MQSTAERVYFVQHNKHCLYYKHRPFILVGSYRGADKSLARHTSRCILFDGENISFNASLVIYINSTNGTSGESWNV